MVMQTRSAFRKACESFDSSGDYSVKGVPPWCSSSGKVQERRRPRKATSHWDASSLHPSRENIWEYFHDDKNFVKRKKILREHPTPKNKRKNVVSAVFFIMIAGMTTTVVLWSANLQSNLPNTLITTSKLITLLGIEDSTAVGEECCYRMKYLASALFKAEQIIRNTQRLRRAMLISSYSTKSALPNMDKGYIHGAWARKASGTNEWGGRAALWGVVPLWRATPPPDIVLATRKPTPSDCWPFSGTHGELIIDFPRKLQVRSLSLEHVRPDTASSAPKNFALYGILENGTRIKTVEGEYKSRGPAKQYFPLSEGCAVSRVEFQVLSNQGNSKYTCIYRVHLYESDRSSLAQTIV